MSARRRSLAVSDRRTKTNEAAHVRDESVSGSRRQVSARGLLIACESTSTSPASSGPTVASPSNIQRACEPSGSVRIDPRRQL